MNILREIKWWFDDEVNQFLFAGFAIIVFVCVIAGYYLYVQTLEPLDSKCPRMATITDRQVLTDKDECLPYWTGQGYILQNNTLNGKYVLGT